MPLTEAPAWLLPIFLIVALLYSSVGHGGASAYLGILALAGFSRPEIAPVVLVLNILVTSMGVINYLRAGHLPARLLLPFVVASIPAAFLGGAVEVSPSLFSGILGLTLLAAGLRFLLFNRPVESHPPAGAARTYAIGVPVGFGLGFLSGLIGIGGGIFLSPLLLIMGWSDAKKTAGLSAAFIVLNSASGLVAHSLREPMSWALLLPLAGAVIAGGAVGSWWGAFRIPPVTLQRLLGWVLLAACVKLFLGLVD